MVNMDYRSRRSPGPVALGVKNRDMSKMQRTESEPDKESVDSFQFAQNLIHKQGNAKSRGGQLLIKESSEYVGMDIYEEISGNLLYLTKKDGSGSKIVEIDRSTFSESEVNASLNGLTGQGDPSSTSLNGFWYWANNEDTIQSYEKASDTVNTLTYSAGVNVKLISADKSRIWGVFYDSTLGAEVLRFSVAAPTGEVTSFSDAGTLLIRGGIANSLITKFNSIAGNGKYIAVAGDNRTEIHKIPEFSGTDQFTADRSTLVWSFPKVGTQAQFGMTFVDDNLFVVPGDGTVVVINALTGAKRTVKGNLRNLGALITDDVSVGYDQENELLLISGALQTVNDRIITFNVQDENFGTYNNVFADIWAFDRDNIYCLNKLIGITDAFSKDYETDNGSEIDIEARGQMLDGGDVDFYKVLHRLYEDIEYSEDLTVEIDVFVDRAVNGNASPQYTLELDLVDDSSPLGEYPQFFGLGVWGGAGVTVEDIGKSETQRTSDMVNIEGMRFEIRLRASILKPFSIRGLGGYFFQTQKPANNLTYTS